jgi:hypothetical protein
MINIIVPFSKPEFKNNTIENFKRQIYKDKKLIIIENGDGVDSFRDSEYIILSSGKHQSLAKNEGIDWIKKNGGGWWTVFDSDDYYGPNYLEEISQNLNKSEVIGKHDRFIKTENDKLVLTYNLCENNYSSSIQGPTITARAEECCYFEEVYDSFGKPVSWDDSLFIKKMTQMGARIYSTSRYNFIQCRYKDAQHVWKITSNEIIQAFLEYGGKAIRLDEFDYDIVNNKKECGFIEIKKAEFILENSAWYKYNKSRNTSFSDFIKSCGFEPNEELLSDA